VFRDRTLFGKLHLIRVILAVSVRGSKPGKNVQLLDSEIRSLCLKSREVFLGQPVLLELEAPLKICGSRYYRLI